MRRSGGAWRWDGALVTNPPAVYGTPVSGRCWPKLIQLPGQGYLPPGRQPSQTLCKPQPTLPRA